MKRFLVHPNRSSTRILIADDHAMFAEGLRVYLEKTFQVIGIVADGRALPAEAVRLKPDVVVTEFAMPPLKALDAVRAIRRQMPNVRLVFLTMYEDANLAAVAIALGRVAVVVKSSGGWELLKAIDEILHGRCYLTPKLRAEDWVAAKARARQFSMELTKRQRDFVQLFAEGRPLKEIAGALDVSEKTVEFHKHRIMVAFDLKSNADLVLFALKRGLIDSNLSPRRKPLGRPHGR
jgi:DNA-binding NarL/FixJ family response regulator